MLIKITAASVAFIALGGVLAANQARSEPVAYPQKVVTLITHSSPGGGSDIFLREMVKFLGKYIKADFVVENISGGSGAKAMSHLAAAKPDGSTFYATTPTYIYTSIQSKPDKSYKDIEPLVNFFTDAEVIYTRTESPFKSLKDVIEHAKAKQGRWGVANPASLERQAAEKLKKAAGVGAAIVPHEGGGDLIINVLNGTLDIGVGEIQELRAQLEGQKVRLLATFNSNRLVTFPDLPTVKELGYDVAVSKFRGLAGPKGLPKDVVAIWEKAVPQLLADPEYKKVYGDAKLAPDFIPHDQYAKFIADFGATAEAAMKETTPPKQ